MSQIELEKHMIQLIEKFATDTEFTLKDLILDPPAQLGRKLYEGVVSGKIPNVKCLGKKADGIERYIKL